MLITDRCAPFDVEHAAEPEPGAPRDGGRGLRLLHGFASGLHHASLDGRNAPTLSFRGWLTGRAPLCQSIEEGVYSRWQAKACSRGKRKCTQRLCFWPPRLWRP